MAGEADNVLALTTVYASKAQAMRAAQAKWDKLQRGVAEFSITLALGRADLFPETPVRVSGFKRVIDEQAWLISKVTDNLNNNGFTTGLELARLNSPMWSTAQKKMRSEKQTKTCKCNFEVYYSQQYASRGNNYDALPVMPKRRTCSH